MKVLMEKRVSYGTVKLIDNQTARARYRIEVNGEIKEVSDDLKFMKETFEKKYY